MTHPEKLGKYTITGVLRDGTMGVVYIGFDAGIQRRALDCAQQHQVWHRDIKPANLIITATGQLKVADFGIAHIENRALTQVDSIIGSPGYMAPELYAGETIDHRVDIFAAGVLLYRLLSGEAPFTGTERRIGLGDERCGRRTIARHTHRHAERCDHDTDHRLGQRRTGTG